MVLWIFCYSSNIRELKYYYCCCWLCEKGLLYKRVTGMKFFIFCIYIPVKYQVFHCLFEILLSNYSTLCGLLLYLIDLKCFLCGILFKRFVFIYYISYLYCSFSMNFLFYFSMVQFWIHAILIYYLWHVFILGFVTGLCCL